MSAGQPLELSTGTVVQLRGDPGRTGVLTGRKRLRGERVYWQVRFPDGAEWVPEDQVEVVQDDSPIDQLRKSLFARPSDLYQTLAHIRLAGRLADLIYSMGTTETDFYAFQFKPILKLLNSPGNGILIADEVGLGKTIEAGLIWTELRARFDFQRLMVLCPAMLRDKWDLELRRKIGVEAEVCDATRTAKVLRGAAAGDIREFSIIASLQGLRPPKGWDENTEAERVSGRLAHVLAEHAHRDALVDLLIIDEAHYMRNPETQTAELGRLLRDVSSYIILLSATPVHLRSEDLFHLLNLVDDGAFNRRDVFEDIITANKPLIRARDMVAEGSVDQDTLIQIIQAASKHPLLSDNRQLKTLNASPPTEAQLQDPEIRAKLAYRLDTINLLGHAVTRTRRRHVKELRVIRDAVSQKVPMTDTERSFYETVTETVREYCERRAAHEGFLLVTPQRQMSSCMAAAFRSWRGDWEKSSQQTYEDFGIDADEDEEEVRPLVTELRRRVSALSHLGELERHDSKYERLRGLLQEFLANTPSEKVVLFSYFRPTLRYLKERLRRDGISCIDLHGDSENRGLILEEFARSNGPSVLLSSEVGSEGIDLQFCWVVINYDLPWNPMKVEQRIGRLDRIGQEKEKIYIWNLLHAETIDERIYTRLFMRLKLFEERLGGLEATLGPEVQRLASDLLARRLSPGEEEARIDQTRVALANVRDEEERLEKEAASLVAYGDYILNQVRAAQDLTRRITTEDVRKYVTGFFSRYYPGTRFHQDTDKEMVYDIELSLEAKNDFSRFLAARHSRAHSRLATNDARPVRSIFENRSRSERGRGAEVISQFHPLIRFVAGELEGRRGVLYPAFAAKVPAGSLRFPLKQGDYCVAVTRWWVEALRVTEQLWFEAIRLNGQNERLPNEISEQLILFASSAGEDWPGVAGSINLERVIQIVEQDLLVRARAQYEQYVEDVVAQNDDRADVQLKTLSAHLEAQRQKYLAIRARHVQAGRVGLARATEETLSRLENRVQREQLEIERKRKLRHRMQEVAVGVIRVEAG